MKHDDKKDAANNSALWDALAKTDPAHTKTFSRAGGFKGTAIRPIWIVKMLTDQFGPCGIGWGINEPSFQVVHCSDHIMVYCTVSTWHGKPENILWGVGGDKVQTQFKSGAFCDDEAFKKSYTDAVNNAFKFIGVGADVHMGLFDDSKYVEEVREEYAQSATEAPKSPEAPKIPGITAIKDRLRTFMREGNSVISLDDFNTLVAANTDDLKIIRKHNHDWWTGKGDFEGYEKWIARRREELADTQYSGLQKLIDDLYDCETAIQLTNFTAVNGETIDALGADDRASFEEVYACRKEVIGLMDQTGA